MIIDKPIYGENLSFRNLNEQSCLTHYLEWLYNPRVNEHLEVRYSLPSYDELVSLVSRLNKATDQLLLGIFYNDIHIGNIKLGPIDWLNKISTVGLIIGDTRYWGNGYAGESISVITKYAHNTLNLTTIHAGCIEENIASYKAFIKSGYQEVNRQSRTNRIGTKRESVIYMAHSAKSGVLV